MVGKYLGCGKSRIYVNSGNFQGVFYVSVVRCIILLHLTYLEKYVTIVISIKMLKALVFCVSGLCTLI